MFEPINVRKQVECSPQVRWIDLTYPTLWRLVELIGPGGGAVVAPPFGRPELASVFAKKKNLTAVLYYDFNVEIS